MIPKDYKSAGWCSKLEDDEKAALWKFMQSWTIIEDAGDQAVFEIDPNAPSYLEGCYQLFLSPKYIAFTTTLKDLTTGMSTFKEGYRAGKQ